ncbi:MAG: AAA family ATPase [Alloprevotella sp.]
MNKIRIDIDELGPVRHQQIHLAPLMLFTGESGLGKSYVNFLAYYLFDVFSSERMSGFIRFCIDNKSNTDASFDFEIQRQALCDWLEQDVREFFKYLYNYEDIRCKVHFAIEAYCPETLTFSYVRKRKIAQLNDTDLYLFTLSQGEARHTVLTLDTHIEEQLCRHTTQLLGRRILGTDISRSLLLPPGRASLLTGDFTAQKGSSKIGLYDKFLQDNDWINLRVLRAEGDPREKEQRARRIQQLIKARLTSEKDGIFIETPDKARIPLSAAASSIRELTPLLQWILGGSIAQQAMCIEEPEAHLHPEMQVAIADLLAVCSHEGAYMQITTHSDYLMQRVNQLIKYGNIRKQRPEDYAQLCLQHGHDEGCYLDSDSLVAYYFSSENGTTRIEELEVGTEGIPMSTFFRAIELLTKEDEFLNAEA